MIPIIAVPLSGVSPPPRRLVVNEASAIPDRPLTLPSTIYPYMAGDVCLPQDSILPDPTHALVALACASPIVFLNPNLVLYPSNIFPRSVIVTAPV